MTSTIFSEIKEELNKGINEYGHPFRFFTLGTLSANNSPRLRTVVFRDFSENWNISFFTDKRSQKVIDIDKNNKVSSLFYHPEKRIQLHIEGTAHLVKNEKIINKHWNQTPEEAKKDYTTSLAPGSCIENQTEIEYLNEENHFCIITIEINTIEYLRLDKPNHAKIKYTKKGNEWKNDFLVP
ncbi:pyridoxamine 5'-phosphate oxidase family protein [Cellulophaga baltica]|uniref:pyridoxamine 5'-phosphate oxidase family protein n=1 Tax=Cellulophaga TaxID=104264 RepID=UPI001C07EB8A|nr:MULTISPECIES: pyridoxamine 5'-phosphate oxidase family protein [Cellulophaga]MBU2996588.1 pyridoxamine 5'-phosphate oxidase family protein [Cellulophaga baltica]MDO6767982.1 pyridoxamine 5'-phosphate oxidase family protein [Cellulophaga sp. 1_MG-2023]